MKNDLPEIKALLQGRIDGLVAELAPEGHRAGGFWMCRSSAHDAKVGGMYVWLRRGRADIGAWRDEVAGTKGDIIGLIQCRMGLPSIGEALKWARGWLGLERMPAEYRQREVARVQASAAKHAAGEAEALAKARRGALAIYIESKKRPFLGSCADLYLQSRGIDIARLGRMPGALGWLSEVKHRETGTAWPALVSAFTADDGTIAAVQRAWLRADGSDKAAVEPDRKIWPSFAGAAVRLWRGESKLSIEDAARHGLRETLVLAEGVEDGLSSVVARPDLRVWCAGPVGNLAAIRLPECVDAVIVCKDNDWAKPQAARQFERGIASLARQVADVRVASSPHGKDVNDALRWSWG